MAKKQRVPKKGDHVKAKGYSGAFVVHNVDGALRAVDLRQIGYDFALATVPWNEVTFLDELDESQNALRVVREATEDH
jgi:hypothetical protein